MTSLSTQLVTGDKRTVTVADVAQTYRSITSLAVPDQGKIQRLGDSAYSLTNYFKTLDCDNLESIRTFKVYSLLTRNSKEDGAEFIDSVRCVSDLHGVSELVSATSKNGRFMARLKNSAGNKQECLEIWDRAKIVKTIDTSELDIHGSINTDPLFCTLIWSPFGDQDKLLYVCQRKRPKYLSFFKETASRLNTLSDENDGNDKSPSNSNLKRGEEFVKREDWGECLAGIEHTIVAVLDVSNNCQITTIDVDDYSLCTPKWLDNGSKIVSVAYKESPRRLGLIYCNNRPSKIMVHDWQSSNGSLVLELKSDSECFHSPRVNHNGDKFIYLSNSVYGVHKHSVKVNIYDFINRTSETLVDQSTNESNRFIGNLPESCFTSDDKHILFVEADHLYHHMCLFSLHNSKLSRIKFPTTGMSIMDFRYDVILASGSEVNATPTLFVAKLSTANISDVVAWHQIEDCIHLDEIEYEPYKIPTSDGSSFVSGLLAKPDVKILRQNLKVEDNSSSFSELLPIVVQVHGGPHSAYTVNYLPSIVFNARLGLQTLLINYRGSTGISEEYLESLSGRVGERDVGDCLHVIRHFVQEKLIDPAKLIIKGGSHGGFLAGHLSCQDEFKFTSAIILNPVLDFYLTYSTSDIPDWSTNVTLGERQYDHTRILSKENLIKFYESSPMSKVDKANVPTYMSLGSKDLRVPMCNGERWVEKLRARGVETLCKVYPDKHQYIKHEHEIDNDITTAIWILQHLPKNG